MKTNKQRVFDFIVNYTKEFKTVEEEAPKFDTKFLSEQMKMQRSNLSSILNQLIEDGKIEKTNGRPVLYYLSKEQNVQIENQIFSSLIGANTSLKEAIQLTKAAITYPMQIPRILYFGEKGVGITTLAKKGFEFACSQRILKKDARFTIVDCSHYNEEKLNEKLLGKNNIFDEYNHGMILLKNVNGLFNELILEVIQYIKNNKEFQFILIVHINEENENIAYIKDYFNFIVHISPLENRSLIERYYFIEKFIQNESIKLNKTIEVNSGLMQCLMLYPCKDNLIELRNNIQFGVANALIKAKRNKKIVIELSDLPPNVRKGLLYLKEKNSELQKVLDENTNYIFNHNQTLRLKNKDVNLDIYYQLDHKYKSLGMIASGEEVDAYVFANIEHQLNDYLQQITVDINEDKLEKIVAEKLRILVKDFIHSASQRFNKVYSNKIYYGICLHLNNAIIKNNSKQRISNENIMEIIDMYDEEYLFTRKFIKKIQAEFNVKFSLDESIYVTLLLTTAKNDTSKNNEVKILIAMHGENTASSIKEVVKKLMPIKNLEAFDLSLDDDIELSYDLLKKKIIEINQGKGILVLYDMGSIRMMLNSIMEETSINIKCIEVPIPLLAMSACKNSEEGKNLDDIYQYLMSEYVDATYSRMKSKDIIIALSSIHENNSESIKRYLQTLEDYRDYQILAFNITDKQNLINKMNEIQIKGNIIGIIGTYNPDIFNIKYIDYQNLPNVHTIHELFAEKTDDFDVLKYLTEQFEIFSYEALETTLLPFMQSLEMIFKEKLNEDTRLGMLIHMGCLIDRLSKKQGSAINFNINYIKNQYAKEFLEISEALKPLETTFNVTLSEDDKATIVEIIINSRKRK